MIIPRQKLDGHDQKSAELSSAMELILGLKAQIQPSTTTLSEDNASSLAN